MKNVMKKIAGAILLSGIIGGVVFLQSIEREKKKKKREEIVRPVKAVRLKGASPTQSRILPGIAKELREIKLAFRVSGPLKSFPVNVGQLFEEKQIIGEIDPRDFQNQVALVQATLDQANAELKAMKKGAREEDVKEIRAALNATKAKKKEAEMQYDRYKKLLEAKSISPAEHDRAKAAFDVYKGEVEALEQKLSKAIAGARAEDLEAKEAQIKSLEIRLQDARNKLSDTKLYAPCTGYIAQKWVENFENVGAGTPVVSFIDCSQIEVVVGVPEEFLAFEKKVKSFQCEFDAFPGAYYEAVLKEFGKKPTGVSQTYPVTLALKLKPSEGMKIKPGMSTNVKITIARDEKEEAFDVPVEAVQSDRDEVTWVWIYDPQKGAVSRRNIVIRNFASSGIEVLQGLRVGEWVVVAGAHYLHEGQRVILLAESGEKP